MATRTNKMMIGAGLLMVGALAAGGCQSKPSLEQSIRDNPTPELKSLYQRDVDAENAWTLTKNENKRMMQQDLQRMFLMDRPSRLAREPIPRP